MSMPSAALHFSLTCTYLLNMAMRACILFETFFEAIDIFLSLPSFGKLSQDCAWGIPAGLIAPLSGPAPPAPKGPLLGVLATLHVAVRCVCWSTFFAARAAIQRGVADAGAAAGALPLVAAARIIERSRALIPGLLRARGESSSTPLGECPASGAAPTWDGGAQLEPSGAPCTEGRQ